MNEKEKHEREKGRTRIQSISLQLRKIVKNPAEKKTKRKAKSRQDKREKERREKMKEGRVSLLRKVGK